MSGERLSDERLCWLAVKDQIMGRTRPPLVLRILGAMKGDHLGAVANDIASDRRAEYAFAVDDASRMLKPEERQVLRQTGQVPAWFLPEVERRYQAARKAGR
jgi:hypothetical protein